MKLEVKIWFGVDEDATNTAGWMVCDQRRDVGNFDIIFPKNITITIPDEAKDGK